MALGTRIGDIWIGKDVLSEPAAPKWSLFASGQHEVAYYTLNALPPTTEPAAVAAR